MGLFDKFFGPPSKDKFAQMVIDAICKAGETGSIVFDPGDFCLRKENRQVTCLANAYIEYCAADQQERENVLKRWVRGWFLLDKEVPKKFEDIGPDLCPSVQSRAYYELMSLRTKVEHDRIQEWPHVIVGEHLAVGLIHDMKDGLRLIRDDELDTWGVTLYEALEVAVDNLKQRPTRVIGPETGEGLYTPVSDDNHDASRLLMLDMIRDFRVKGDPIAMIPTRDMLLVAGSEDCDALSRMLNLARNERDNEHHVISTVGSDYNDLYDFNGSEGTYLNGGVTLSGSTLYGITGAVGSRLSLVAQRDTQRLGQYGTGDVASWIGCWGRPNGNPAAKKG